MSRTSASSPVSSAVTHSRLVGAFRIVAHLEAVSWAGLLLGMTFEYLVPSLHDLGDQLVLLFGSIHGGLVLAYGALGASVGWTRRWDARGWTFGVLASFIPFATVPLDRWAVRTDRYRYPSERVERRPA